MHQELIGQEASFRLPCGGEAPELLLSFIEELLEVGGSDADEPERLEEEMRAAVDALCGTTEPSPSERELLATLKILEDCIEVRLSRADGEEAEGADERRILTVREA